MDCRVRFNRSPARLFRTRASASGTGKISTVWMMVRITVFHSALRNSGFPSQRNEKFAQPTQSASVIPR
jgi:hypothetical protein